MKTAAILGPREAGLADVPDPKPVEDLVLVKVHVAPMCTEYKTFIEGKPGDCHGHEAAGEVAALAQPGRVDAGQRVVVMPQYPCGRCALCLQGEYIHCQHNRDIAKRTGSKAGTATMAQYLLKPDWLLIPIPGGVSYEHASMACCALGPSFGACERMRVGAMDTLLVTGLGPVGLGAVVNGRHRGARVIGIESNPYRAKLARELGAEVLDPGAKDLAEQLRARTDGRGADAAIDCAGVPSAQLLCLEALRRRGQLCFVAQSGELTVPVSKLILQKGLSLHGQWHYNLGDAPKLMRMIQDCGAALDKLITHTFPMSKIQEAWEVQASGQCGKVLLKPWS
ncbi:MAG: zinc-binding dehydrogenase [Planctomycetota bacterium]|nr:zinc-binding dehydrogenase [Planctomycetota bacterium]